MKKESKRLGFNPDELDRQEPSLHDLYFTDDLDLEEELRLIEEDPRLADVVGDPTTLTSIQAELSFREGKMEEQLTDLNKVMSKEELSHLSPEARELIQLGLKVKAEEDDDEPKVRLMPKRSKRIFFAIAAIIVLSMAVSITGATSMFKYLKIEEKGEEQQFRFVESEANLLVPDVAVGEKEAYEQADKFFGQSVVQIYGYLADLEFDYINIFEEDGSVDIAYNHNGSMIFYSILSNYNQTSQMAFLEEDLLTRDIVELSNAHVTVEKHSTNTKEIYNYTVTFTYNQLYYKIHAYGLREEVIENIIKFITF